MNKFVGKDEVLTRLNVLSSDMNVKFKDRPTN